MSSPFRIAVINDELGQDFGRSCEVASREFGMEWIELRGMWNKNTLKLDATEVAEARRILEKYKLRVTDIASPLFKVDWPGAPKSRRCNRSGRSICRPQARRLPLCGQPRDSLARRCHRGGILSPELGGNERTAAQSRRARLKPKPLLALSLATCPYGTTAAPLSACNVAASASWPEALLRPLARLVAAILHPQKIGIVVERFGSG